MPMNNKEERRKGSKKRMKEIIFLTPVLKEMIWGGNRLKEEFGYEIPGEKTGECWAVSAHPNGDCLVRGGRFDGNSLGSLFKEHRELFGGIKEEVFPLLVKIIDAREDLSIQVHPDDAYAKEHEHGALGKTECWYILDCDEDATIVVGHHANSKDELRQMIEKKEWDKLIHVRPIKKGDFFQIEPGTVHAIKGGTLILETQQNSDITYRLYDYDRLQDGKPRELHIEKSIDVIRCPQKEAAISPQIINILGGTVTQLVECNYYRVKKLDIDGEMKLSQEEPFTILSVLDGEGTIDGTPIRKGDHFILPFGYGEYCLSGTMMVISSGIVEQER